jgi:hypothetical protein
MSEDLRNFLVDQAITISLIKRVIINYKKFPKTSVTFKRTRAHLSDLKTLWLGFDKAQYFHSRIILAATAEDRKKLFYFLQDEFYAEDAYNDASDQLQDATSGVGAVIACVTHRESSPLVKISLLLISGKCLLNHRTIEVEKGSRETVVISGTST